MLGLWGWGFLVGKLARGAGARVLSGVPESDPCLQVGGLLGREGLGLSQGRRQLRVGDRLCLVLWGAGGSKLPLQGPLLSSAASAALSCVIFFRATVLCFTALCLTLLDSSLIVVTLL